MLIPLLAATFPAADTLILLRRRLLFIASLLYADADAVRLPPSRCRHARYAAAVMLLRHAKI